METNETTGKLRASRRHETGKGAARKLRARGLIPAVCYGAGAETISIALDPLALAKSLDPERKENTVIELTIDGGETDQTLRVMLQDYHREAVKRSLLHADFLQVTSQTKVRIKVPVVLEGKPEGVKAGGTMHQVLREVPVLCTPDKIPSSITAEVSALDVGQVLQIRDLVVPEGVRVMLPDTQTLVQVLAQRKVLEEKGEGEGAAAAPAGEGGAA